MRSRRSVGILASLCVSFGVFNGCVPTTDTTASATSNAVGNPTVSLDPNVFLVGPLGDGGVPLPDLPCTGQPGGMQSYVATVTDVGPLSADGTPAGSPYPLRLPSSPPTACSQSVYFAAAVQHHYEAVIDGYEEPVSKLVPVCSVSPPDGATAPAGGGACTLDTECFALGCYGRCLRRDATTPCLPQADPAHPAPCGCLYTPALGDRHMLTPGTAKLVTPRWTTPANQPCGYHTQDVALAYTSISITPCSPLTDTKPGSTPTGLEIVLSSALGTYGCATSATVQSVVTKIDIIPKDLTLTPVAAAACGGTHTYTGLAPNQTFVFTLDGYKQGDPAATLTTSCSGKTVAGLIVTAVCDPFVAKP